jgi:ribosomal protein L24
MMRLRSYVGSDFRNHMHFVSPRIMFGEIRGVVSMTQSRRETRLPVDLELRVWGMGLDGRVFSQPARTGNVSIGGALLSGIEHDLKIGDTIGVLRGKKKARCKVVWAINTESMQKIQVGVQLLSKHECPWTAELPKAEDAASISPQNRRRWERHKISVVIALYDERATTSIRLTASDISASGCYVETMAPFSIGTNLKVDLWIGLEKITTRSFVRTSDPGLGMGIEFIGLKREDQQRFQKYLKALNPWGRSIDHQNSGAKECAKG